MGFDNAKTAVSLRGVSHSLFSVPVGDYAGIGRPLLGLACIGFVFAPPTLDSVLSDAVTLVRGMV